MEFVTLPQCVVPLFFVPRVFIPSCALHLLLDSYLFKLGGSPYCQLLSVALSSCSTVTPGSLPIQTRNGPKTQRVWYSTSRNLVLDMLCSLFCRCRLFQNFLIKANSSVFIFHD